MTRRDAGLLILAAGIVVGLFPPSPAQRLIWFLTWGSFAVSSLLWLNWPLRRRPAPEGKRTEAPQRDWSMHLAHDFRTPLMRLRLHLARLAAAGSDAGAIAQMEGELLKLERLAEDFIDLTAGESQWDAGDGDGCDVARLVEDCVDRLRPLFDLQGRPIMVEAAARPRVDIPPRVLERILDNLLSNALRYAEGEGQVEVRLYMDGPLWARLEVTNPAQHPGAEPAELLEPFVRGANAKDGAQQEGFGLGLAVAQRLAASAGGKLRLSYLGEARCFRATVVLPRSTPS